MTRADLPVAPSASEPRQPFRARLVTFSRVALSLALLLLAIDMTAAQQATANACADTLTAFVTELDDVMAGNPTALRSYEEVLAKYLFKRTPYPTAPKPAPGASIEDCRVEDATTIARRSRFFSKTEGPPRYKDYRFEFRNRVAEVTFFIDRDTAKVTYPTVRWIKPHL
jgi:hypothetical protein